MKTLILLTAVLITTISFAQVPSYVPANGLVGWWPFNGNADDESGNGNNGVVNGATLADDRNGVSQRAYQFNSNTINLGNSSQFSITNSGFTVSVWVNKSAETNLWHVLGKRNSCDGADFQYQIASNVSPEGVVWGGITPGENSIINSNIFINTNQWYMLVGTFDGTSWKLYINGTLISSLSAPLTDNVNANLIVGNSGSCNGFIGKIDDIAIYNRALTQAEVNALYTALATNTGGGSNTTSTNPAPPGIPYQAEVRNESGEVLANANVNVRFTLHELTANGTVSYKETHALTTNELGLFAATIGAGTPTQGTFAGINWSQTTKFLQVEVDTGNGYITMGNQQLMSVPYALYAANGPAGPQGPVGPQGPSGEQGPAGANGNSIIPPGGLNGQVITMCNGEPTWTYGGVCPGPFHGILRDTCNSNSALNPNITYNTLIDQDGYSYKTVVIGNQEWMAENLRATIFSNGNDIVNWVYLNRDSTLDCPYGKLYSSFSISDSRNVCPAGWHVPYLSDWNELITFLDPHAYDPQSYGFPGLLNSNSAGASLSSVGFSVLPTGIFDGLTFQSSSDLSYWWSSSRISGSTLAYVTGPNVSAIGPDLNDDRFYFAVRCIKND